MNASNISFLFILGILFLLCILLFLSGLSWRFVDSSWIKGLMIFLVVVLCVFLVGVAVSMIYENRKAKIYTANSMKCGDGSNESDSCWKVNPVKDMNENKSRDNDNFYSRLVRSSNTLGKAVNEAGQQLFIKQSPQGSPQGSPPITSPP